MVSNIRRAKDLSKIDERRNTNLMIEISRSGHKKMNQSKWK